MYVAVEKLILKTDPLFFMLLPDLCFVFYLIHLYLHQKKENMYI